MIKTEFSDWLHGQKYRGDGESFRDAMHRVASALSETPEQFHQLRDVLLGQRFLPAGRVQSAVGSPRRVTPYNCFVSGVIEDSFVEGDGSIMARATEAAATMRMGGGIGYDFSTLRPRGALISKLGSGSSGPVSFMEIYDAVCRCVASSGHRRGAQMGVLRVDHPDVEEFVRAKQNRDRLTGFNVSVAVTDEFMMALRDQRPFALRFGGKVYREIDPVALWEAIMRSTWDWAEPGILFVDAINRMNNLWYCEQIAATNPCGEQPLPPNGACLLGSFNLVQYLVRESSSVPRYHLDLARLISDVPVVVRAMDNVIDRAIYPLPAQEQEAKAKRRMGLGVTGLANALEAVGLPYGSEGFQKMEGDLLATLARACYLASVGLACEKGPFPLFDAEKYLQGGFALSLDDDVRELIRRHGVRNSHLTSIAPAGTISLCADNVSSGVEPVFSYAVDRVLRTAEGDRVVSVTDHGVQFLGVAGKPASRVTIDEHVGVLLTAQHRVDSAVSKTCNVPADTPWNDFKDLYARAWEGGAKGCTTYQVGGKRQAILTESAACRVDLETGRRECE